MSPNGRFCRNPDHISRIVDDQVIVVLIKDDKDAADKFFVFNETGSRIWGLIDGDKRVEDIAEGMCGEFDISKEAAETEISEFLKDLARQNLVTCK